MRRVLVLALALGVQSPASALGQAFSLEQVMGAAFPSGLVSDPGLHLVAWVQDAAGVRNVLVAGAPDYEGRRVTNYDADDGQEIAGLAFAPDGRSVIYVRGGAPNRQGVIPNPTSNARWPSRAIWTVPVGGGDPVRLAEGSAPAVSPSGNRVAFIRKGQIWSVSLDGGEPAKLFTMRGAPGSLRWSPDGARLAFVSRRGDHSFVGVFDLATERVTWMMPSVDRDANPAWAPDGEHVAFTRTPNVRRALPFEPRREGHPWSILVADVTTGHGHVRWTADPGPGSVFQGVVADNGIFWAGENRLVFPWEKTGWKNLYSIAASGDDLDLQALTPGAFEVEHVSLTADGREVVFSSNQGDIDRRHLWRVEVRKGPARQITSGEGIEWAPVVTGDGGIAYLSSGPTVPAHARRWARRESRALDPSAIPADFPGERLVTPEAVIFAGADGLEIHGQLFRPRDLKPGERRPALIFFHGGSRRQMLLGFHYIGYYHNAYAMNQYLASRGYVVLAVNYRSGIGYGLNFREAIDYGARGASEFNDVLGAGLYLRSRDDVDPHRIGLWGGSYGGYLTALGLARASDLFAAGVDFHGVHDWNVVVRNFVPSYNAEARAAWSRLAYESSPMASVDTWRSPVLLIHGDDDRNVPFSESVTLMEALRERGVEVEQLVFPDEVHGFLRQASWLAAYHAAADFFDRKLKGR